MQVGDYAESLERTAQEAQEGGASFGAAEGTPPAPVERRDRRETYSQLPADQLIAYLGGLGSSGCAPRVP
jgi:hypothetical protein